MVENTEYIKFARRIIKSGAKRVGQADEHDLRFFASLRSFIEEQMKEAIHLQLAEGKSWNDIGIALEVTKQAAYQRYK